LTSRLFNSRQTRKTLAFSKDLVYCCATATWEDMYYNLVKHHKACACPSGMFQDANGCHEQRLWLFIYRSCLDC